MEQPEGFVEKGEETMYCKLRNFLYGLTQSGRCWNDHFDVTLKEIGFIRNQIDRCVYKLDLKKGIVILVVYVDDIFTMSENEIVKQKVKTFLDECFEIKHFQSVSHLLGVELNYLNSNEVILT